MFAALDSSPYGALANIDPKFWPEMGQWGSEPPLKMLVAATNATNHTSPYPSPLQQLFGNLPCVARNGAPVLLNPATKFFTHCFLSVFGLVWALMFGLPLILRLRTLLNTPTTQPRTRSGQLAFLAAVWAPMFLLLHTSFSPQASVVPADLVLGLFMLISSAVHRIQDGKVAVCSQELLLFWLVEAVVYVGWVINAFLLKIDVYDFWMLIAGAVCAVLALVLEVFNVERQPQNYYNDSSVFSKVVIGFATPVLEKCRKEGLTPSDFTKVPVDVEASTVGRQLATALAGKMGDYNSRPDSAEVSEDEGRYKVMSALFQVAGTNIGLSVLFSTLMLAGDLYVPIMVMNFLRSLANFRSGDSPLYTSYYVALQFAVIPGATLSLQSLSRIQSTFTDTKVRAALLTNIYRKAFNLSPKSREKYETSKIMTLTSVDTNQVLALTDGLAQLATMPIMLIVAIVQLWKLLGYSFIGGVLVYVLLLPAQSLMTSRIGTVIQGMLRVADERSKLTSNVFRSIKSLKLYGWERPFAKFVENVRASQLGYLRSFMVVRVLLTLSFNCASDFVAIAIFTFFLWVRQGTLSPEVVFPSLLLLQMVSLSTMSLPMLLVQYKQGLASCGRLYAFFAEKDHQKENYEHHSTGTPDFDSAVIQVNGATVSWNGDVSDEKIVLQNVNWEAKRGDFVCVVGRVGAGKTAMLRALCGELCITEGEISLQGSLAYSAQESWLQNMTLKDNILFGQVYEEEWYNRVIEACELTKDIADMPEGHETNVGERGISLSGGQKARVALARAVYSRSDVVILDDVLSAVDEHVSKALVEKLFSSDGLLANRTIILATNNIKVLSHSSRIVALADKQVVETSSFSEVVKKGESSSIYQLIKEFGHADDLNKSHEEVSDRRAVLKAKQATDPRAYVPTTTEKPAEFSKFDVYAQKSDEEEEKTVSSIRPYLRYYFENHPVSTWLGLVFMLGTVLFRNSIIAYLGVVVSHNFQDLWSARWYFTTYVGIALCAMITLALNMYFIELMMSLRNSQTLHDQMLWSTMRAPMKFFDKTPLGRLINRFTGDLASVDSGFAEVGTSVLRASLNVVVTLIPILIGAPQLLVVVIPLGWWANSVRTLYVPAQRKVTRIYSAANSPVLSHIEDSMKGQAIVRSFGQTARFEDIFVDYVNYWAQASFFRTTLSRWINARISLISLILSFGAAMGVTQLIGWNIVGVSYAGVILNYCERSGIMVGQTIQAIAAAEVDGVALERIYEYIDMDQEAPYHIDATSPAPSWPAKGEITFNNLTARYTEDGPDVLKNLTLKIKSGEKIGVVGRTGSGKSTLTLAIFRLLEAHKGAIEMDKINTSILGLGDLRSRLSIVPQDAQIFDSSVRDNLDPLHTVDDARLWEVLELCHLKSHFEKHDGLDTVLADSGSQLSRGQAQLLCLGRALVHQSKILVLDEATASVDHETDKIIQETIRKNMAGRTIITVAHRLNTIMDSDRVLVLDKGEIKEFDTPQNLLDAKGLFYGLHNVEEKLELEEGPDESN